jgi:hypothetical protein
MKLFGYSVEEAENEEIMPYELAEITLVANPEELRKMAIFLSSAANNIETMGNTYSHEHLSDKIPLFVGSPHFVVVRPE